MSKKPKVLYQDRRFTVTVADIKTPTIYYPVADTVGRVRKDIQFAAVGLIAILSAALAIYWDLWLSHERLAMGGAVLTAGLIGVSFSILQIDARGFPSRMFVARSGTVKRIFSAITEARTAQSRGGYFGPEEEALKDLPE